ncbi:MAG: Maf family protein [Anaerolineae bacterium]|nr:Maf family protein [Anaerolineae bacterium]
MKPSFILASSSPRRRELLASLGIPFSIRKPDIDETQRPDEAPTDYVQRLSAEKAAAVAERTVPPAVILAADTIVIDGGEILGKPVDGDEARMMLLRLRGRPHAVCTAITVYPLNAALLTRLTCTTVHMRPYTDAEIDAYIATGDPFDKAGSYAIQHPEFAPVARVEGSETNVIGLPLETLRKMLAEIGWNFDGE